MAGALINVPARAKRGEIIEIKTLISHPMETGFRRSQTRRAGPARHHPAVRLHLQRRRGLPRRAAIRRSPPIRFIAFSTIATESGTLAFQWTGDNGFSVTESAAITVE